MSSAQVGVILRHIRRLAAIRSDEQASDRQLLERFATLRDEAAFAALLQRHGSMVLGVCQNILHNRHDAEDAFQATFLVLAQKADSIHRREAVSGWLYQVAYRLAVRAKVSASRRRIHEQRAATMPPADPVLDMSLRELRSVLDEELQRLPEQYRAPLVLCALEEKSLEEAAHLLGWSKGAVKGRLQRGRERLRQRLRRRGLELSVGLLTIALSTSSMSAQVPAALAAATLRAALPIAAGEELAAGVISAPVAALVQGASQTMFLSKTKIATILVLAIGISAAGLGAFYHREPTAQQADTVAKEAVKPAAPAEKAAKDSLTVRGCVLDPDGQPFAGAKLYLNYYSPKEIAYPVRATSGKDGRFAFTFAKSELDKTLSDNPWFQVMATAKGHGCDWASVGKDGEVTLRLVKDMPISGRVLDADGAPVAGAKVRVLSFTAYAGEDLTRHLADIREGNFGQSAAKSWIGPFPEQSQMATTKADGRFRLSGFGRERIVRLGIEGQAIESRTIEVMTRASKTIAGTNNRGAYGPIYGAAFDHLAAASRPIRGVVRDKKTGKPLAGVQVSTLAYAPTNPDDNGTLLYLRPGMTAGMFPTPGAGTRTDQEGHYELLGLRKSQHYQLTVRPADDQVYFAGTFQFDDTPGLTPFTADIELVPGISLKGRVTDKATGKPIAQAVVKYFALFPNPNTRKWTPAYDVRYSRTVTGTDGSYTLAVLPGPGVVAVASLKPERYVPALVTPKEIKDLFQGVVPFATEEWLNVETGANAMSPLHQPEWNALVLLNPDEKADTLKRDIVLDAGQVRKGSVVGPDGRPFAGATITGLTAKMGDGQTLKGAEFTVMGLRPGRSRNVVCYHQEKDLGGSLLLKGDEKGPITIKLQSCGEAVGRIVDKDGQPVAGLPLMCQSQAGGPPPPPPLVTDRDGRFRVKSLVPGLQYDLFRLKGVARILTQVVVEPGKTKELGDLKAHLEE